MLMIGLMSGTSADGVDAALVDVADDAAAPPAALLAYTTLAFDAGLRDEILRACDADLSRVDRLCVLQVALAEAYAEAAREVARLAGIALERIAGIASHGQTVWHQPMPARCGGSDHRGTLQIGSAAVLAARTGCRVITDFRSADMAAGGQGAPLVPYADWVLLSRAGEARAMQNIGGIANVTYLPASGGLDEVIAFDTGPGNMVMDAVVALLSGGAKTFDEDGAMAARGCPSECVVDGLIAREPFFSAPPPKSTGREVFGRAYVEGVFMPACRAAGLSDTDTVATAAALTARSVAEAYARWVHPRGVPSVVILGGGGARNATLVRYLTAGLAPSRVTTHAEFGIPDDAKEAIAFAILGHATLNGIPSNVPSATGAAYRAVLGSITPPPKARDQRAAGHVG
jgi:anhydro-N-acetylmuramic acid kinase